MKVLDYNKFAYFDYESVTSKRFQLGDIVINKENEIGVIIQIHDNDEFRTDMFGNCDYSEIKKATKKEISTYRSELLKDIDSTKRTHDVLVKRIDLQLLKKQKKDLVKMDFSTLDKKTVDSLEGILNLLDHITDEIEGF